MVEEADVLRLVEPGEAGPAEGEKFVGPGSDPETRGLDMRAGACGNYLG